MRTYEVGTLMGGKDQEPWGRLIADDDDVVTKFEPLVKGIDKRLFADAVAVGERVSSLQEHYRNTTFRLVEQDAPEEGTFARRLYDIRVKAGMLKGAEPEDVEKGEEFGSVEAIVKADEEKKIVYGWAYVTHDRDGNVVVDKSGEFVDDIEEIEKTAVHFMLHSRKGDVDHTNVHATDIVESMVFTPEKMEAMGIAKGTMPSGWWIGVKCSDSVWEDYKAGKYKAFSVHGKGLKKAV